ncbi:unnamed protein product [Linum tenue]|uniref:Polygalacturonase n=3 Tax=Linum tenue TaxID=586396 RepID=A0AAV0PHY4_9ROSI|nr:unnamed protein product [Linum tenue]
MAIHSNLISLLFLATAITILTISPPTSAATRRPQFNVVRFGARPDGRTDSTRAFLTAWTRACGSRVRVIMLVPKGRFLVRNMQFTGPCKNRSIFVRILGTIVAPNNIWTTGNSPHWIEFHRVDGVTISGGVLDGKGAALWACKKAGRSCPNGATTLSISNSQNVVVSRLTSLNSHMFHMVINFCHNVKLQGVRISAPGNSPNTDGIHVQFSTAVSIVSSKIATGDDCVSIGPGTANMLVDKVTCGPGHGISIGSLGKDVNEQGVQNVTVRSTTFVGTTNGFRIKAWGKPSNGFARNILFQHATMYNVQNPIFIDQRYCPDRNCADQVKKKKKVTHFFCVFFCYA